MPTSAERFYNRIDSLEALRGLIGQPEDADFDCKEWSPRQDARRGTIAKAACGFANATGGVIAIGVAASGRGADTPDLVRGLVPVPDRDSAATEALDIILKFVEPGIEGIEVRVIADNLSETTGFVVIFIPAAEGSPRRSRIDGRFYVRIASGTVPMEYFQVEERFGRRPSPRLSLHIEPQEMMASSGYDHFPLRHLLFGLKNEGRGIAKFPGIRFKRSPHLKRCDLGLDGNGGVGLPWRASEPDWIVFRGGVDDVIFPLETRLIGKLVQVAVKDREEGIIPADQPFRSHFELANRYWVCQETIVEYELFAEGSQVKAGGYHLEGDMWLETFSVR